MDTKAFIVMYMVDAFEVIGFKPVKIPVRVFKSRIAAKKFIDKRKEPQRFSIKVVPYEGF